MAPETPRNKRPRVVDGQDEDNIDEPTPRPGPAKSIGGENTPSLASSHTDSQASGTSSPSKQLSGLELDSDGIQIKVLTPGAKGMPSSLSDLLLGMEDISHGLGVVPLPLKVDISRSLFLYFLH